jgi:predicted nucleotidyltransferase
VFAAATTWTTVDGRARWNGEPLSYWADALAAELVTIFDPIEVWLFGSVARGDDSSDSDIDILVVLDRYDTSQVIGWKQQAQLQTSVPAPFDVTFSDPARMSERSEIAGTIERAVRREGELKYRRG